MDIMVKKIVVLCLAMFLQMTCISLVTRKPNKRPIPPEAKKPIPTSIQEAPPGTAEIPLTIKARHPPVKPATREWDWEDGIPKAQQRTPQAITAIKAPIMAKSAL